MSEESASNVAELTVSELASSLKRTIETNYDHVRVRGELGRVTIARSGHMYADIKDEKAVLNTVMWKGSVQRPPFRPEEGLEVVAEMAAIGFGLDRNAFTDKMKNAPHLLAPTGSDLSKYGAVGTVFAGYHYDLNFLSIHGKSRYPGLHAWLRDGRKMPVKIPEGCLLLQAGKQIEWLTGGHVLAGMHEVVCTEGTKAKADKAREEGKSLWRISSTVFGHINSDQIIEPLGHFATEEACEKYKRCFAGDQVQEELNTIKLGPNGLA